MFDRIKANELKTAIHTGTIPLIEKHDHLLLTWATGVGKSLAAIKCAEHALNQLPFTIADDEQKILLLTKEVPHQDNWKKEFDAWGYQELWSRTTVICYQSLEKYKGAYFPIIICDEAHCLSELRESRIESIGCEKIISLSATVTPEVKSRLYQVRPYFEYHISMRDAIERGILPEPSIKVLFIDLEFIKQTFPAKYGKTTVQLRADKYYAKILKDIAFWQKKYNEEGLEWQNKKVIQMFLKRKRFIAELKTDIAKEVLDIVKDERFICFCGSVEQAKQLGGKNAIHSKNKPKANQAIIDSFNALATSSIFSCKMLTESQNLTDIESAILVQLDGVDITGIQRMGRALRGESPTIYVLVCKNTRDEEYLSTFERDLNPNWIQYF